MWFTRLPIATALVLLVGCSTPSSPKPSEVFDERTGMTVEELHKPIELTQSASNLPVLAKHISFAYLGPVEWDRSGTASYGLWVHLAPGNDWQFGSIQSSGAVTLILDGESTVLKTIDPPQLAHAPYKPVAPWGQTAYFDANAALLKRMGSSQSLELEVATAGGRPVRFAASAAGRDALARYVSTQNF